MAPKFLISLLHIAITCVMFTKINTFSLPMIPIDSSKLQMFPQSLNTEQRYQLLANITRSRASSYSIRKGSHGSDINSIKGDVDAVKNSLYVTQVFFGTTNVLLNAYLLLDSGASHTWVQCQGCDPCIQLKTENVNPQSSLTYKLLSPTDKRCDPGYIFEGLCHYGVAYGGGASTFGKMGTDTFIFRNSASQEAEFYPDLAFGCGYHNTNFDFGLNNGPENIIAGIFGLTPGRASFVTQLDAIVKGRFSYCLTSWTEEYYGMSTIHFGDAAQIGGHGVHEIPLSVHETGYHLFFNGISVEGNRLAIDLSPCTLGTSYTNGFFIDSGAPYTLLPSSIYQPLRAALVAFFAQYGWSPVQVSFADLCYPTGATGGQRFPNVVFHFENAGIGLEVPWAMTSNNMFITYLDGFCMAIYEDTSDAAHCILGAFQHANFRVLYDFKDLKFAFKHERCQENQ